MILKECKKGKRENKNKAEHLILIDIQNAYPSVDRDKLFEILDNRIMNEIDRALVNNLKALLKENKVKIGEKEIELKLGIAQGSILAPNLFNIYLDEAL